jgi:hypothetical protein
MNTSDDSRRRADDCTTTTSFTDHGLDDGSTLVRETYYRLATAGYGTFDPSEAFFDRLESAFVWSYLSTVDETAVPPHVAEAITDATALTFEEFQDARADLRTEVIPAFYQRVAGFHCVYRG